MNVGTDQFSGVPSTGGFHDEEQASNVGLSSKNTNVVSASTAGIRALTYQMTSLYLRTPAKIFRPSRFDYLATTRILQAEALLNRPYSVLSHSSILLLYRAVKKNGWRYIPDQVLPPLIANSVAGVVLYTTYLTTLQHLNDNNVKLTNLAFVDTFRSGFLAGAIQSFVSAPIDAIFTRSSLSEIIQGKHTNLWQYGVYKLKQIGPVGVFAGFGFNLIKDSIGFAFYFSVFEMIKTQGYNVTRKMISGAEYYKAKVLGREYVEEMEHSRSANALHTTFILFAGASAALCLIGVQYPFNKIQKIHLSRLEALDIYNENLNVGKRRFFKIYYKSYIETILQVESMVLKSHLTFFEWCYKGFVRNALSTIPATSIGLLVFEILRQRLSDDLEEASRFES